MEPPYDAVPIQQALWWHPVHMHDAAHMWLRETTARVAEMMEAGRPTISRPPECMGVDVHHKVTGQG
jgi:hypothetical protein